MVGCSYSRFMNRDAMRVAGLCLLLCVACDEEAPQTDPPTMCPGRGCPVGDAGPDDGDPDDGGPDDGDPDDGGTQPSMGCTSDADCDDGLFCTGVERCVMAACLSGPPACGGLQCDEPTKRCDCHMDKDGVLAWFCNGIDDDADGDFFAALHPFGGADCDDRDPNRFKGNLEVCDYAGHDEDCDVENVGSPDDPRDPLADKDGDGNIDARCINIDPDTGAVHGPVEADCDDEVFEIHPGEDTQDYCDNRDNDCDGLVDEAGDERDRSAQRYYCRDKDGDKWTVPSDRVRDCGPPDGYQQCRPDLPPDCDDDDNRAYPGRDEICDDIDNDCDGTVDRPAAGQQALVDQPWFDLTDPACTDGRWHILTCPADRLWCDDSTVLRGCETDATRLSSCRACHSACVFACGTRGCDEIQELTLGAAHSCALTREGKAACWGRGSEGRIGDDSERLATQPRPVLGLEGITDIAAGTDHTCAIAGPAATVFCWGSATAGQLGSREVTDFAAVPVQVAGFRAVAITGALRVDAGERHSCAVLQSGQVLCWGTTLNGLLGDSNAGSGQSYAHPVVRDPVSIGQTTGYLDVTDAADIALGDRHSCLLTTAGAVQCWGENSAGQLGDGYTVELAVRPTGVALPGPATQIAAGGYFSCALIADKVYCWGINDTEQLGLPSGDEDGLPKPVPELSGIVRIAAGFDFACALTRKGQLLCWGGNALGQTTSTEGLSSERPAKVPLEHVTQLALGEQHACAQTADARVYCWGSNLFGQSGNGVTSLEPQPTPRAILALLGHQP